MATHLSLNEERPTGKTLRYIYRGECGHVWRRAFPEMEIVSSLGRVMVTYARLPDTQGEEGLAGSREARVCPRCQTRQNAAIVLVKGTEVEGITCNAECQEAIGPVCRCSCGGERHGERWERREP